MHIAHSYECVTSSASSNYRPAWFLIHMVLNLDQYCIDY